MFYMYCCFVCKTIVSNKEGAIIPAIVQKIILLHRRTLLVREQLLLRIQNCKQLYWCSRAVRFDFPQCGTHEVRPLLTARLLFQFGLNLRSEHSRCYIFFTSADLQNNIKVVQSLLSIVKYCWLSNNCQNKIICCENQD